MKKVIHIAISILFFALLLTGIVFGTMPGAVRTAYAETTVGNLELDETNVLDDLETMTIDGTAFDITDYSFDENQETQVIYFAEYCYSFYSNLRDNYSLYVYIWNPKGLNLSETSVRNKITLRFGDDDSGELNNYKLLFLNKSEKTNYEGLFYKFRVYLSSSDLEEVFDNLDSSARVYYAGEIQLVDESTNDSFAVYVGTKYTYTGYAVGYGAGNVESTLDCTAEQTDTLSLDVQSTFFRPEGTGTGIASTQDTLHSVYFSVPDSIIELYGDMTKIHATWLNATTAPMFVTGNLTFAEALESYVGVDIGERSDDFDYAFVAEYAATALTGTTNVNYSGTYAYNWGSWGSTFGTLSFDNIISQLNYLFYDDEADEDYDVSDYIVSSEDYFDYIEEYTKQHGGELVDERFSAELFSDVDEEYTETTIEADEEYMLTSTVYSLKWYGLLTGLIGTYTEGETSVDYEEIPAIESVSSSDLSKYSQEEFCERYFISESDYDDFAAYFETAEENDETVYLFRYKTTEYYAAYCTELSVPSSSLSSLSKIDENAYLAIMDVQLGFDIIDVTFSNGETAVVLAVVADPVDNAGEITSPIDNPETTVGWWAYVLAVLFVLLVLVVVKLVCSLLSAPKWVYLIIFLVVVVLTCILITPLAALVQSFFT